ncbi:hypothetical protein KUA08_17615, partial [Komagataeibacter melomenusus]|nr:hypothetical protein [Komagataeibacter melomenusus]
MKTGSYVNQGVTLACVVITGICFLLACGLGYWCGQLKQERDKYKPFYEYYQQQMQEQEQDGNGQSGRKYVEKRLESQYIAKFGWNFGSFFITLRRI